MFETTQFINDIIRDISTFKKIASKNWIPAPKEAITWKEPNFGWSIEEIMQHLAAFATHYIPILESEIIKAHSERLSAKPTFNTTPEYIDFFNSLGYEGLEELYHTGHFQQVDLTVGENYTKAPNFIGIQDELLDLIAAAKTVDLAAGKIPTLVEPNTFFSIGDCLQFIVRHQILHFAQAEVCMDAYDKAFDFTA